MYHSSSSNFHCSSHYTGIITVYERFVEPVFEIAATIAYKTLISFETNVFHVLTPHGDWTNHFNSKIGVC